jgi:DNA mismatch endonuclease (patch repair protein)
VRVRANVVFTKKRLAIFVDGCFWHGCPEHGFRPRANAAYWSANLARNAERGRRNNAALRNAGWKVLRIWEYEGVDDAVALITTLA